MINKDGLWTLSPSGLYNFIACPACFWADQHMGRMPSLPLRLNDAMDLKCKSRYDAFRKKGELPPEIGHLKGISLYSDLEKLDLWRSSKTELAYENKKGGYVLAGKIDELLVNKKGELIVADYKSSGDEPKPEKIDYYLLQLHAYALLFQKKGYKVAPKAYLLNYFPKNKTNSSMSVELACKVIEAKLDIPAFEKTLKKMVKLLDGEQPEASAECKTCGYHKKRQVYLKRVTKSRR